MPAGVNSFLKNIVNAYNIIRKKANWQKKRKMWSNQENRVRKQVKNPCEARKIKASQNLHKIISTHLLIMEVDFCPVLCILEVPVLQAFRGISHFVWYCKAVSDLS